MRKNELGDFADLHHVPRPHKKQKKHQRGFSEDVADKRRARVNFKNYLRELEEELLEDDLSADDALDADKVETNDGEQE